MSSRSAAFGFELVGGKRGLLRHVRQQLDGRRGVSRRHRDGPTEALRAGDAADAAAEHLAFFCDLERAARHGPFERRANHQRRKARNI